MINTPLKDLEKALFDHAADYPSRSDRSEEFPVVHGDDLYPVSVIEPDLAEGPWIAGGAPLRWYENRPVGSSDIDVFCRNSQQAKSVIKRIKDLTSYRAAKTNNAQTYKLYQEEEIYGKATGHVTKEWAIQIITCNYYESAQQVVDRFDITVCQIATAGTEWVLGKNTAADIRNRRLRFADQILAPDAVKRLVKYWTYGYRPDPGMIATIINNPDAAWSFDLAEDYDQLF